MTADDECRQQMDQLRLQYHCGCSQCMITKLTGQPVKDNSLANVWASDDTKSRAVHQSFNGWSSRDRDRTSASTNLFLCACVMQSTNANADLQLYNLRTGLDIGTVAVHHQRQPSTLANTHPTRPREMHSPTQTLQTSTKLNDNTPTPLLTPHSHSIRSPSKPSTSPSTPSYPPSIP